MRTISTADGYLLQSDSGRSALLRVSVKDGGGTFRDLTTYPGQNLVLDAEWSEDIDSNGLTAKITLLRGGDQLSLSPLHQTSPLNKQFNPGAGYQALILPGRDVLIETAILPDGFPQSAVTWREAFRGRLDTVNFGDEKIQLECRDQVAILMDTYIEVDRVYALAQGGSATKGCRIFEPSTSYVLNELIIPSEAKLTGYFYKVTTAGTVATSEPSWPTTGTVASGSAVFTTISTTSQSAGTAVQTVMQQILTDNGTGVTLSTPVSPGWSIRAYHQERKSVWEALRALVDQIGFDLRFKWNGSTFALTFSQPTRASPPVLRTFQTVDVVEFSTAKISLETIRNAVQVFFSDSQDRDTNGVAKRKKVVVTDSSSIATYGRRFMELQESSSSNIDTTAEATALATVAIYDLATPVFEGEPTLQFFPFVEINDFYSFIADGLRFTSTQSLAVIGYTHSISGTEAKTSLRLRGSPRGGLGRWLQKDGMVNPDDIHALVLMAGMDSATLLAQSTPGGVTLSTNAVPGKTRTDRQFEFHVSDSSPYTPTSATLVAAGPSRAVLVGNLQPGQTYYARTVSTGKNAERITRGEPSEPTSFVAGYVEIAHLNPETVVMPLPPNGNFEGFRRGSAYPPDHWSMVTGAWGDDCKQDPGYSGLWGTKWANKTGLNGIQSAFFPVRETYFYALSMWLKRFSSETQSVTLALDWYTAAKAAISTSSFDTVLTTFTAWGRVVRNFVAPSTAAFARVRIVKQSSSAYQFSVDAVECVPAPGFTAAAGFDNDWGDFPVSGYETAGSTVTLDGIVRLKGLVKRFSGSPTAEEVIFTLPADCAPTTKKIFCVYTDAAAGRIDVYPDATVRYLAGGSGFASLAGITFDTR